MAADGPQVGTLGRGLGPLLGAHGLYGGGGLPEGGGVSDGAVPLVAVDVEDVSITPVYAADNLMSVDQVEEALKANTTGETTYTVVRTWASPSSPWVRILESPLYMESS